MRSHLLLPSVILALSTTLAAQGTGQPPPCPTDAIEASGGQASGFFSQVSVAGGRLLVGEPLYDGTRSDQGRLQFFKRTGGQWISDVQFNDPFPTTAAYYGAATAMSGSWAVVGRPFSGGTPQGSIRFFMHNGTTWTQHQQFFNGSATGQFGGWRGLAMTDDTVIASAYAHDGVLTNQGAAWTYVRNGATWQPGQQLLDPIPTQQAEFGRAVAIDDTTAAVSAFNGSGLVYIYRYDAAAANWFVDWIILPSVATGNQFGFDIDLDGEFLVVGARRFNGTGTDSGAIFIFRDNGLGNPWTEEATLLTGNDTGSGDLFGTSVALNGVTVFAGAPSHPGGGAAYLFRRKTNGIWAQEQKVQPPAINANDNFGHSIEAGGTWLLIGAPYGDGTGTDTGTVHILNHSTCPLTTL